MRFFGAIPSPVDERDYKFEELTGAAAKPLPYYSNYADIIVDQGLSSQCGPCALVAARSETEYLQTGQTRDMSRTYVYGCDDELNEEGMYLRTLMKIGCAGIPYVTTWESWGAKAECRKLVRQNMTDELRTEAKKLRGSAYYSCNSWTDVCNATRATHGGVIILVKVYENWYNVGKDGVVGTNSGVYLGNHFVRVKDYEILDGGKFKIRFQNSWGTGWGDGGYGYLHSDKNGFIEAKAVVDNVEEVRRMFTDVEGHWAKSDIEWCNEQGLMSGFEDNTFRPDEPITRAQMASILRRLAEKE